MKPWLFDILACPIDKHYPLKLYIFKFETNRDELKEILSLFKKKDLTRIKKENIIKISETNGVKFIKDNIMLEKTQIQPYLQSIIKSINELDNIIDKTNLDVTKEFFQTIKLEIKPKVIKFLENPHENNIDTLIPELYLLNKFKLEIEIETGLLYCEKCKRWYPIIDTIPQMLPDKYRDEKKDLEFLKINKNLLDEKFLNQDLKPFNINILD